MSFVNRLGVSSRIIMLIAVAILPFAILIGIGVLFSYDDADRDARSTISSDAQIGAAQFSRTFLDARTILSTMSAFPQLSGSDRAACDAALSQAVGTASVFTTIGVVGADGTIVCHSRTHDEARFGDPKLAARAFESSLGELVVGDFMIGPISKRPVVDVAMRVPAAGNDGPRIVFGSLDLNGFEAMAELISGAKHHTVSFIDVRESRVLARYPNIFEFGTKFEGHPLIKALADAPQGGTVHSIGFDNVNIFFGYAPVVSAIGRNLAVAIGLPEEEAFAGVGKRARWVVGVSASAFLSALVLAALLGYFSQVRPIAQLTRFAETIGDGGLETAIVAGWQAPEFKRLEAALLESARGIALRDEAQRRFIEGERRFRLVADNTADMISAVDNTGKRTFVSGASMEILGYEPGELIGIDAGELAVGSDSEQLRSMYQIMAHSEGTAKARYRVRRKDERVIWVEVGGKRMVDGSGYVFTMRDVSERKTMEDRLELANLQLAKLATTDALTGLANRRRFDEVLVNEVERANREKMPLSVLMVDVDRFKGYNDRYGHPAGDECLRQVAVAIQSNVKRPGDLVARYGGEEFAVVLPNTRPEGAVQVAQSICDAIASLRLSHDASEFSVVTASVGVASSRTASPFDASDLVAAADSALYSAKSSGRNRIGISNSLD